MIWGRISFRLVALSIVLAVFLPGCVTPNKVAMTVGAPPGSEDGVTGLELREIQTQHFETDDIVGVLRASTATLQDLGFTVTESCAEVGVLVASKQRDAEESGQIAGQMVLALFGALLGAYTNPTWDKEQTIYMTLIADSSVGSNRTEVRVLLDRRLINNHGQMWRAELIEDPEIYQEFFQKLSEALFLEVETCGGKSETH